MSFMFDAGVLENDAGNDIAIAASLFPTNFPRMTDIVGTQHLADILLHNARWSSSTGQISILT